MCIMWQRCSHTVVTLHLWLMLALSICIRYICLCGLESTVIGPWITNCPSRNILRDIWQTAMRSFGHVSKHRRHTWLSYLATLSPEKNCTVRLSRPMATHARGVARNARAVASSNTRSKRIAGAQESSTSYSAVSRACGAITHELRATPRLCRSWLLRCTTG